MDEAIHALDEILMRALAKRTDMWLEHVMPKGALAFTFTFTFIFSGHVQVEGGVAEEVMEYANEPPPPPRVYRSLTEEDPWARTATAAGDYVPAAGASSHECLGLSVAKSYTVPPLKRRSCTCNIEGF